MSRNLRDKIEYAMLCIGKFADANALSPRDACAYLHRYEGLKFLDECYSVESTFSPRIVVEDLRAVCRLHGGSLA